jgi:hypothetical protein
MKTLDLITGVCFGFLCILSILIGIIQTRFDLFAISFITGVISKVSLQEYRELKRKES